MLKHEVTNSENSLRFFKAAVAIIGLFL